MPRQRTGSKQFGVLVRAAREEEGLNGHELAEKVGMNGKFIWSLERGDCSIQPHVLDLLCKALPKLEKHKDMAPKPLRMWEPKAMHKRAAKANGVSKRVKELAEFGIVVEPVDNVVEFVRMVKRVGIAKAFELVKLIETVVKEKV
jgi:transcriptional regulator with XRE-family HTH domain